MLVVKFMNASSGQLCQWTGQGVYTVLVKVKPQLVDIDQAPTSGQAMGQALYFILVKL